MKTAAIYARVSSAKQKEENTIASQTAALIALIKQLHALIGTWLSFWSARRPATTLEDAMLALTVRLISVKRGWIAERTSPFPFTECLAGIANEDFENTFRNEHVDSGVSLSEYGSLF